SWIRWYEGRTRISPATRPCLPATGRRRTRTLRTPCEGYGCRTARAVRVLQTVRGWLPWASQAGTVRWPTVLRVLTRHLQLGSPNPVRFSILRLPGIRETSLPCARMPSYCASRAVLMKQHGG